MKQLVVVVAAVLGSLVRISAQNDTFNWADLSSLGVTRVEMFCQFDGNTIEVRRDDLGRGGSLLRTTHFNGKGKASHVEIFNIDQEGNRRYNLYGDSINKYEHDASGRVVRLNNTSFDYDEQGRLRGEVEYMKEFGMNPSVRTRRTYSSSTAYVDSIYAVDESGLAILRECWNVEVNAQGMPIARTLTYHVRPPNEATNIQYEYSPCGLLLRERHMNAQGVFLRAYQYRYTIASAANEGSTRAQ